MQSRYARQQLAEAGTAQDADPIAPQPQLLVVSNRLRTTARPVADGPKVALEMPNAVPVRVVAYEARPLLIRPRKGILN